MPATEHVQVEHPSAPGEISNIVSHLTLVKVKPAKNKGGYAAEED